MTRQSLAAFAVRLTAAGLSFSVSVFLARILLIDNYGAMNIFLAVVNVGTVISLLGHESLATRTTATTLFPGTRSLGSYLQNARREVWFVSISVFAGACVVGSLIDPERAGDWAMLPLLFLIVLLARTRLSQGVIRGAHLPSIALVPEGIIRPGFTLILLAIVAAMGWRSSVVVSSAMLVGSSVALMVALALERKTIAKRFPAVGMTSAPAFRPAFEAFSRPMFAASIFGVVMSQMPVIMTGLLANDEQAGLFTAAERISLLAGLFGQTMYQAISSRFAALHASEEFSALKDAVRMSTRIVALSTLLPFSALLVFSTSVLEVFGGDFFAARSILVVLLCATLVNVCAGPTGILLLMTHHEREYLMALSITVFFQLLLLFALIPRYGAIGAAYGILSSTVLWNFLMAQYVHARLKLNRLLAWA